MSKIIDAFNAGYRAGKMITASELPNTVWGKWVKKNYRQCEIIRGDLMTFVCVGGLYYLSEAIAAFKASPEHAEMRDIDFSNYNLYIAYANNWNE